MSLTDVGARFFLPLGGEAPTRDEPCVFIRASIFFQLWRLIRFCLIGRRTLHNPAAFVLLQVLLDYNRFFSFS